MLPEGSGQFIAGVGFSEGSRRFDSTGAAVVAPTYRKVEAGGYLEYGLTPWLSLILAPTLAHAYGSPATNEVTGSDSSAFGARVQIYGTRTCVVALQVLVEPPIGDGLYGTGSAADIRLMIGQSFQVQGLAAFIDLEPGTRVRSAPYPDEARLDITAGLRPTARLLLLVQDFNSLASSSEPLFERQSYSKLQVSSVYDLSRTWSVQAGVVRTIAGRNAIRENGPLFAVWYRF